MSSQIPGRPTVAVTDLDALALNFHSAKNFIGPGIKYMAVVKANAYGHGIEACAMRLESEGVDWFGVALPEEGNMLRRAGVSIPILCLGSFWPGQEEVMVTNRLTPVIFDERAAVNMDRYASSSGLTVDVHVKIDTGMGRVGKRFDDVLAFAEFLEKLDNIRVSGLLTHFAAADDPDQNKFTELQIERFNSAINVFRSSGHSPECFDLANSPAAITNRASQGNLVRLGGALYGLLDDILPTDKERPKLKPVLSLSSEIANIKDIPVGESIGYGRTFVTERDSRIALVPIGYADGYPRSLSNCGRVVIREKFAPVVGRISMDWTLVDVTDIPEVAVNDTVFLIGEDGKSSISAADIAGLSGTIGYEIACGISPRVPRIFIGS